MTYQHQENTAMTENTAYEPTGAVDKRRVTMRNYLAFPPAEPGGEPQTFTQECVDYVRPDFLDAYVADAQTRWQEVLVSEEPDAGPGGYDGATHIPADLEHPLAGQTFPATEES